MSLNKVILIGNVGRDPEVKYFDNGGVIANLTVATNERGYTLANGTVVPERTEWHNVVARKEQAQFIEKYVKKGSGVYVEGKIRTRDYEKDGVKRYVTEIHADRVEFYGSTRKSDSDGDSSNESQSSGAQNQAPVSGPTFSGPAENSTDDLPF
jgi:single-strand DNA-binding protein